jgi:hypothetical protein
MYEYRYLQVLSLLVRDQFLRAREMSRADRELVVQPPIHSMHILKEIQADNDLDLWSRAVATPDWYFNMMFMEKAKEAWPTNERDDLSNALTIARTLNVESNWSWDSQV